MRLSEAVEIIRRGIEPSGYRVHFEWKEAGFLRSDYFPDRGEHLLPTEEAAWALARQFAAGSCGRCVNIYVIDDKWSPVASYRERMIENREPA